MANEDGVTIPRGVIVKAAAWLLAAIGSLIGGDFVIGKADEASERLQRVERIQEEILSILMRHESSAGPEEGE